jgi:hypothetical protein
MTPTAPAQPTSETLPGSTSSDRRIDRLAAIRKGDQLTNSIQSAQRRDHRFYLTMAILAAITVFIGYFPTYYQKPLESVLPLAPSPVFATIIHIHGALMTTYVLFYVLQTALVSVHRKALHMTLGWASVVLLPALVILGTAAILHSAKLGLRGVWPDPESAALANGFDIYLVAILASIGIALRAKPEVHKRLMLISFLALLPPPLARTPLIHFGPGAVTIPVFAFILTGPIYDLITRRRIHPAYLWSLLFFFATTPATLVPIGRTQAWRHFVDWLIR